MSGRGLELGVGLVCEEGQDCGSVGARVTSRVGQGWGSVRIIYKVRPIDRLGVGYGSVSARVR